MLCDGIRVGGHLQHADLHWKKNCQNSIVQHYHGIVGHSGVQAVLPVVLEKFWIIKGNSAVRHYLRECRICRFWKSKACKQLTALLPKCRVSADNASFHALVWILSDLC